MCKSKLSVNIGMVSCNNTDKKTGEKENVDVVFAICLFGKNLSITRRKNNDNN